MFNAQSRFDLSNKIAIGGHNLLQTGHHLAAGGEDDLPIEIREYLIDRLEEGLSGVMRGPVIVPLSHAPDKKVQKIEIW